MFSCVCFSCIFVPVSTLLELKNPFCKAKPSPVQGSASRPEVVLYHLGREANVSAATGRSEKLQS